MSGKAYIKTPRVFDIKKKIEADSAKIEKALIDTLYYVGESCIKEARYNGDYNDITGNLRSSIGYVVLKNGSVLKTSRPELFVGKGEPKTSANGTSKPNNGAEGVRTMRKALKQLAAEAPQGLVLIVAAGMKYAIYVEARFGKNVLTSSKLLAEQLVPDILRQLGFRTR